MRKPLVPATVNLLLLTQGLIAQVGGEKKKALKRAWIMTFNSEAAQMLGLDEGRLPNTPRAATEELLRLVLQLMKQSGMSGMDLTQLYGEIVDSCALMEDVDPDQAIRRGFALLGLLTAQRMTAELPPETDEVAA